MNINLGELNPLMIAINFEINLHYESHSCFNKLSNLSPCSSICSMVCVIYLASCWCLLEVHVTNLAVDACMDNVLLCGSLRLAVNLAAMWQYAALGGTNFLA